MSCMHASEAKFALPVQLRYLESQGVRKVKDATT